MNNNFNPLTEKNVLNLYADFLKNIGIELSILKDSDFEKEIELIQIKLSDEMLLNLLFLHVRPTPKLTCPKWLH